MMMQKDTIRRLKRMASTACPEARFDRINSAIETKKVTSVDLISLSQRAVTLYKLLILSLSLKAIVNSQVFKTQLIRKICKSYIIFLLFC